MRGYLSSLPIRTLRRCRASSYHYLTEESTYFNHLKQYSKTCLSVISVRGWLNCWRDKVSKFITSPLCTLWSTSSVIVLKKSSVWRVMALCFIRQHHYLQQWLEHSYVQSSAEDLAWCEYKCHHRSRNSTWKRLTGSSWAMKVNCLFTLSISSLSFIPTTSSWIIAFPHKQ